MKWQCRVGVKKKIFVHEKIKGEDNKVSWCNFFYNCLFICKHFMSKSLSVYSHVFILTSNTYEQNTRSTSHGLLTKLSCNTWKYNTNTFAASGIVSQNFSKESFLITVYVNYYSFFKDYLHCKIITPQNVLFEAQVRNFLFRRKVISVLKIFKFLVF